MKKLSVLPIFPSSMEKFSQNQNQHKNNRKFPMKINKWTQALTLWQPTWGTLPQFNSFKIGVCFCLYGHIDFGGISVV